jgi:hypothetical protein
MLQGALAHSCKAPEQRQLAFVHPGKVGALLRQALATFEDVPAHLEEVMVILDEPRARRHRRPRRAKYPKGIAPDV